MGHSGNSSLEAGTSAAPPLLSKPISALNQANIPTIVSGLGTKFCSCTCKLCPSLNQDVCSQLAAPCKPTPPILPPCAITPIDPMPSPAPELVQHKDLVTCQEFDAIQADLCRLERINHTKDTGAFVVPELLILQTDSVSMGIQGVSCRGDPHIIYCSSKAHLILPGPPRDPLYKEGMVLPLSGRATILFYPTQTSPLATINPLSPTTSSAAPVALAPYPKCQSPTTTQPTPMSPLPPPQPVP
jgi:hypothetical protein